MPQITIICPDIPDYLREGMSKPKAATHFLQKAIGEGIARQQLDPSAGRPLRVSVSDDLLRILTSLDKKTPTPVLIGEYINGAITKLKASTAAPADAQRSVYQRAFYEGIAPEIAAGKIVLAEGATGIGKGRVLARIAKEQSEAGHGPVAVAAPSVAVLKQLIEEWLKAGYPIAAVSCILGKQQFVDTTVLRMILEDEESEVTKTIGAVKTTLVLQWLADGCHPMPGNQNSAPIKTIEPTISCLEADLLHLAPELEPFGHHYQLSDHSSQEDDGYQAYETLRQTAREDAEVIFCTHAMVAYDIMAQRQSKNRVLPEYRTLLVDEAHLFERNMANIHTHSISVLALRSLLRTTEAGSKAGRDACIKQCSEIMGISSSITTDETSNKLYYPDNFTQTGSSKYWLSNEEQSMFSAIVRLRESLSGMLKKSRTKDSRLDFFRSALDKVANTAKGLPSSYPVLVNNTPVRKWPVITTGKRSVEKEFTHLWEQVKGAVLVSATMSVPSGRSGEGNNREYIYSILHIPPHRGATPPPVVPAWLTQTPVLHLPDPGQTELCYPAQDEFKNRPDDLALAKKEWQRAIANELVTKPGQSAVGGILVLLSSYEDVEGIASYLAGTAIHNRLLIKTRTSSIEKQKQEFKTLAREGKRPIWLALGNAWTGLDLRDELVPDENPAQDEILTDLVIPRINFADNQSISHLLRQKKQRSAGFTEAAFTLRQGLGRLVRRPGVKDRHIWFFDNRINHRKAQYNVFRHILSAYVNRGANL